MRIRSPYRFLWILLGLQVALYLYSAFLSGQSRFGFDQIRHLGPIPASLLLLLAGGAVWAVRIPHQRRVRVMPPVLWAVGIAALSLPLFAFLHNGLVNVDGLLNIVSLSRGSIGITIDDMLSMTVVRSIYFTLHPITGISPQGTFILFSGLCGSLFVMIAILLGKRVTGRRWPLFLLLMASGGFMQLFFGDSEFYAGVAMLIALYCWMAYENIHGKVSLLTPSLVLSAAMSFHLLAGWLLPSLGFLIILAVRRGRWKEIPPAIFVMLLFLGLSFVLALDAGLDIREIGNSHALGTGETGTLDMLAKPSPGYFSSVANVLFLLFPWWGITGILLLTGNIRMDSWNVFLLICSMMLLIFSFVWDLALGPYFDWNLVASTAIPVSILTWRNLLIACRSRRELRLVIAIIAVGTLHSYSWILSNHALDPDIESFEQSHPVQDYRIGV